MKLISPKSFILFPFVFSVYPVLALIAHNAAEMNLADGVRAILFSLILAIIANIAFLLLVKDPIKAALLTVLFLLLFFSYGHINLLARRLIIANQTIGRHRVLIPIYLVTFIGISWLIIRSRRNLSFLPRLLNIFAIFLLIIPLIQIFSYLGNEILARSEQKGLDGRISELNVPDDFQERDVYYVLLDGYPRYDFISEYFFSDNSEFLTDLEMRGFFVAHCSQSNYTDTRFSMASTLNMEYLDNGTGLSEVVYSGAKLDNMISANKVSELFSDLGYTIITFESGYKWLRWQNTDLHLDPAIERARREFLNFRINEFEKLFLDTTLTKIFIDIPFVLNYEQAKKLEEIINSPRASHRDRVLFSLDKLGEIPTSFPGPIFVYAHIIFPHPPFILDAEGNGVNNSPEDEMSAYNDQIHYLNKVLIEIVDSLLSGPEQKPIIILQSDHGATIDYEGKDIDKSNRLGIFNAYYFPDNSSGQNSIGANSSDRYINQQPYSSITPVNTFRLIFDRYFGGNYELLEDKSIVGRQSPYTTIECVPPSR